MPMTRLLVIAIVAATMAAVPSWCTDQEKTPHDLTARPTADLSAQSVSVSLPFARSLSLSLFRDYAPPPRQSLQQPKSQVGWMLVGGGARLSLGEFHIQSTVLQSGAVIPTTFPSAGTPQDALTPLLRSAPANRLRSPSAFQTDSVASLVLWQGAFRHQSVGYQSHDGRFRATLHYAEADPNFRPASPDFAQKLAAETGLQMPLNAVAGVTARQAEVEWKPNKETNVRAFANTTTGQRGGVVETRAVSLGNARWTLRWDRVRADNAEKLPAPAGAAQQQIVSRALTENNNATPVQLGNWQLWRVLDRQRFQASYTNKGVTAQMERLDIQGTGGNIRQRSFGVDLGGGRLIWQRQNDAIARGTNPEALKALGLAAFIPRIGWQSSRELLALQFSPKDAFRREEFRLSNGTTDIVRNTTALSLLSGRLTFRERTENTAQVDPNFLKAVGLEKDLPKIGWSYRDRELRWQLSPKDQLALTRYRYQNNQTVLEREGTQLSVLGGRLQWEERRERLSEGVNEQFLKAIGWEQVKTRLGWTSMWQQLTWQITPKDRLLFNRTRHERAGTALERTTYALHLADGKVAWERTQDEATPSLSTEQLKALGLTDIANRIGWRETRDRFAFHLSPTLTLTHTRSDADALPDAPQPYQQRTAHETVLTFKPAGKSNLPPTTLAFGGWTLLPKGQGAQPVTERHLRWDTAQTLPLLGGLNFVLQRHFSETQQGGVERDYRYARTVIQTPEKAPLHLFVERVTKEETNQPRKETLNARLGWRFSDAWRLTSQLTKVPQGNGSVETRQHALVYQPRSDFSITAQLTTTEQPLSEHTQTEVTVKTGGAKRPAHLWQLSRFTINQPTAPDVQGWRLVWQWQVPNRLCLTAQWARLQRSDDRDGGEEKVVLELPSNDQNGLNWRIGYWRLSLLDPTQRQQTAQQLAQAAQATSQPVVQAGTPPASIITPQADLYRTVWVVVAKGSEWHLGAQVGQAVGGEKGASDHRFYFELPATKTRPLALRLGYWKLERWDGSDEAVPVWRAVVPLGKGKLVWGGATFRDQAGELPMREFALTLPLDRHGSQLVVANQTNMPPDWASQQAYQSDWMRAPGGLALAPQITLVRQQLAPYKTHRATLTLRLSPQLRLVGDWQEQIGVPNLPITHDWRFALEITPAKTSQWRLEWARLRDETATRTASTTLLGLSYSHRISDAQFITFSLRWLDNPTLVRPNFVNDRWLASLSLSQRW